MTEKSSDLLTRAETFITRRRSFVAGRAKAPVDTPRDDLPVLTEVVEPAPAPEAAREPDPGLVEERVQERLQEVLPARVEARVEERLAELLPQRLEEALANRVEEALEARVAEVLPGRLAAELPAAVEAALPARLAEVLPEELAAALPARLAEALPAAVEEALPASIEAELPARLEALLAPRIETAVLARLAELASYQQPRITRTLEDWIKLDLRQVIAKELDTLSHRISDQVTAQLYHSILPRIDSILVPSAEDLAGDPP
jgi:hypothetical protein